MRLIRFLIPVVAIAVAGCDFPLGSSRDPCGDSPRIGRMELVIEPQRLAPFSYEFIAPDDTVQLSAWLAPVTMAVTSGTQAGCTYFYGNTVTTTFEWRSADAAIATVDVLGRVVGRAPGRTLVTVRVPNYQLESSREVQVALRP